MAKKVVIQRMGQTMKEGTIVRWMKADGESVKAGDHIYELEYDKSTVEVEAPVDGTLHILVEEGATLPVGTKVAEILGEGETAAPAPTAPTAAAEAPAAAGDSAPAVAYGISASAKRMIRQNGLRAEDIRPANGRRIMPADVTAYMNGLNQQTAAPVKASPLAAKVAEKIGLDLHDVPAGNRVMAQDILQYLQGHPAGGAAVQTEEVQPMSGMRRAIAKNMLASHMTSPTVTYNTSVDMFEMKRYREQLKSKNVKVSYTDLLVKFVSKALLEFPLLNCTVNDDKVTYKHYVNMGVAVALDNGLVVPNVVDADRKSLTQISAELKELAAAARAGTLSSDKMENGTFTITNLGMYGIEHFTPIINQPEVAILGVNAMIDTPVVRNGEVVVRPIMNLSLTADHRVVDGSVAAEFLQRVRELLENPALMLA